MNAPCISVLMPAYNAAGTVADALESILAQSFTDFECLAVDDGSTDDTAVVLEALAARDARVRVLRVPHGGIVSALNAGLAAARGNYIARMDADDYSLPERLKLQYDFLECHPCVGMAGCRVAFGGGEDAGGYARYVDWTNTLLDPDRIAVERFRESPFAHPSVMFRASLIQQHGPYRDGPFPEDYELWLRWMEAGVRLAKLPQTLLRWDDPPTRLSRTDARYGTDVFYAMKTGYLARWLAANNPFHPHISVIGAGRMSRRRAMLLRDHGIVIDRWIDVDPRKIGNVVDGVRVCGRDCLPAPEAGFSLAYLAGHGAADDLEAFLHSIGYVAGRDYLLAS
ncbi:glycosyltransferase [Desulfovibrio mangrovi]|uniref:glycosyltransferase family 2 protein n=1 Tax=Desulfovibrio mangrovi TaxID=2976983 RepID=UPI0022474227|nr:glycosyltransferase family 2 protein [Desulfovibrio mangrovi]UZP66475.1 glycosyltransferase [Desulfovibrio mangrovi]